MYINMNTHKTLLSIDSVFRPNYNTTSASTYTYTLPTPIKNVVSMTIKAIEIPNFWYAFSNAKKNNQFTLMVYNYKIQNPTNPNSTPTSVSSTPYSITLPEGNYLNIDFVNFMNAHFANIGGGLRYIIVEVDANTGKTIFRARHPIDDRTIPSPYDNTTPYYSENFYFTLDFRLQDDLQRPLYRNMGWTLGFTKPFYLVTYDNVYTTYYIPNTLNTPNHMVQFNGYQKSESSYGASIFNYVFLDIEDGQKMFTGDTILSSLAEGFFEGNNLLGRITVHSGSNSINLSTAAEQIFITREYYGPVTISSLNIRLLDKFGEILAINGNDFSFLIEMTTVSS